MAEDERNHITRAKEDKRFLEAQTEFVELIETVLSAAKNAIDAVGLSIPKEGDDLLLKSLLTRAKNKLSIAIRKVNSASKISYQQQVAGSGSVTEEFQALSEYASKNDVHHSLNVYVSFFNWSRDNSGHYDLHDSYRQFMLGRDHVSKTDNAIDSPRSLRVQLKTDSKLSFLLDLQFSPTSARNVFFVNVIHLELHDENDSSVLPQMDKHLQLVEATAKAFIAQFENNLASLKKVAGVLAMHKK